LEKKLLDLRGDWGPEKMAVRDLPVREGESWGSVGEFGDTLGELDSPGREEIE
jgi:hypothetical protein